MALGKDRVKGDCTFRRLLFFLNINLFLTAVADFNSMKLNC